MLKKRVTTLIALLSVVVFSSPAWASVDGTWDIVGTGTVKVSIQGFGSDSVREPFVDEFVFNLDGTFDMIDMGGLWSQSGTSFIVEFDLLDVETYFENGLSEGGLVADVTVISASFKGKESKDGSAIKGKFSMKMDMYINDLGASGKVSAKASFTGSRAAGPVSEQDASQTVSEKNPSSQKKSFPEAIAEKIREAISSHGVK